MRSQRDACRLDPKKLEDAQPSKARALVSHKWYRQAFTASRWVNSKIPPEGKPKHDPEQLESEEEKSGSKPNEPQPLSSLMSPATPGSNPPSQPTDPSPPSNPNLAYSNTVCSRNPPLGPRAAHSASATFPWLLQSRSSPNLVVVTAIKDMMKCGQPYLGVFLLKDEHIGSNIVTDINSVYQVGMFAQTTSAFAAAGQKSNIRRTTMDSDTAIPATQSSAISLPTSPPTSDLGVTPLSTLFLHNHAILIDCQYEEFGDTDKQQGGPIHLTLPIIDQIMDALTNLVAPNMFDEPGKLTDFAAAVSMGIKKESGVESDGDDRLIEKLRERVKGLKVPEGVRKVFDEKLVKLRGLEPAVSRVQVTRDYLDWLTQVGMFAQTTSAFAAAGQKSNIRRTTMDSDTAIPATQSSAISLPTSPPTSDLGVTPLSTLFLHNHAILIDCQYEEFGDTDKQQGGPIHLTLPIIDQIMDALTNLVAPNMFDEPGKLTDFAAAVSMGIKKESGVESDGDDRLIEKLRERVKGLKVPEGVRKVFDEKLVKLRGLEPAVSRVQVTRDYLDWLTQIL
ncbi:hypothetical protein P691DRAFT_791650 [Macrolepiota fuliginosa MF-IS2]|uniref:Uncharacterized protein n=1 Tax=Macrolepiota fuliginosa MF-IS2 TaxID=1400762 RepID=A0A9P5WZB6_9AGAR|nr:hypothetical protein P691DRAFT_791650 [Macrolepiota fuliginosa MF-IS2]